MTELTPETITDEQVNSFFENEGDIKAPKPDPEPVDQEPKDPVTEPERPVEEKKVNYGALHEERMRRKEATERAKALEAERDEFKRQLEQYSKPQEPSYDDDPLEAVRRENQQIKQVLIAQANQAKRQTEDSQYWSKVKESEIAYKQEVPDFDDAIKHLADTRLEELRDLGFSDQEASKVLSDEIRWISDKAYADEVNPAERFYNLAKRRGWNSKPPEVDNSVNEKLDRIEKGMKTNRQLPPASKSIKQDLTAEALADMNVDALSNIHGDTDFDKAWKKLFG